MENKIIVMLRLQDGNSIECSLKTGIKPFTSKDAENLKKRIKSKFKDNFDDALYYTIRIIYNGKKDNYKLLTYEGLLETLDRLFKNCEN